MAANFMYMCVCFLFVPVLLCVFFSPSTPGQLISICLSGDVTQVRLENEQTHRRRTDDKQKCYIS